MAGIVLLFPTNVEPDTFIHLTHSITQKNMYCKCVKFKNAIYKYENIVFQHDSQPERELIKERYAGDIVGN